MIFKRFILVGLLFIGLLFFSSCLSVYFDQPQPKNGVEQNTIPEEMQGRWESSTSTIIISKNCMIAIDLEENDSGDLIAKDTTLMCLSDSINIQKANEYFIVNLLDRNGNWGICAADILSDGTINWYYPATTPFFGKRGGLKVRKVTYTYKKETGKRKTSPLFKKCLKPNKENWEINEVYYTGQFKIKNIDKIIIPENLFWSLKPDGTISAPN